MPQFTDAAAGELAGLPSTYAASYLAPDGIFPRMRLIAAGWLKPGDTFKRPDDKAWWAAPYRYALWPQLRTYARVADIAEIRGMLFDEDVAKGDPAALSQSLAGLIDELAPVMEAPCPRWLVPTGPGQLPVPNPDCLKPDPDKIRDEIDKVPRPGKGSGDSSWLWALLALAYLLGRRTR